MTHKEFDEFLDEQLSKDRGSEIDWTARRNEWQLSVSELYKTVESFLEPYTAAKKIGVERKKKQLTEDFIGKYDIPVMTIRVGTKAVVLDPIGTLVVGARGRVDMIGPNGALHLLLVDEKLSGRSITVREINPDLPSSTTKAPIRDVHWTWKIATRAPRIKFLALTDTSFLDALMAVANG